MISNSLAYFYFFGLNTLLNLPQTIPSFCLLLSVESQQHFNAGEEEKQLFYQADRVIRPHPYLSLSPSLSLKPKPKPKPKPKHKLKPKLKPKPISKSTQYFLTVFIPFLLY